MAIYETNYPPCWEYLKLGMYATSISLLTEERVKVDFINIIMIPEWQRTLFLFIHITGHIHKVNQYFPCPNDCGRQYKWRYHLNNHLRYECGGMKNFICTICQKAFARKAHLKVHMLNIHKLIGVVWLLQRNKFGYIIFEINFAFNL